MDIDFLIAFAILAGGVLLGAVLPLIAISGWKWLESQKRCVHRVRAGSHGRCPICSGEAERIQKQYEAEAIRLSRRRQLEQKADELRKKEIERLSKAWLSKSESYMTMSPQQFETAISELFRLLGYKVRQTPFSNDGGKDAIAEKDGRKYLIECKRYSPENSIGRRDLQIFVAAIGDEGAGGGFYINTGVFTRTAKEYAEKNGIQLYDHWRLPLLVNQAHANPGDFSKANVMCVECGEVTEMAVLNEPATCICINGHSITSNLVLTDLRVVCSSDAPYCDRCGSPMRIISSYGRRFLGCARDPNCKATKPLDQPTVRESTRWQMPPSRARPRVPAEESQLQLPIGVQQPEEVAAGAANLPTSPARTIAANAAENVHKG